MRIPGWAFMNFYSVFIAVLIFIINQKQGVRNSKLSKLFGRMTLFLIFLLIIDSFGRFTRDTSVKIFLNNIGNFFIFLTDPIIGFFIANYIDELTTNNLIKKKNKIALYASYAIIILNIFAVSVSELFNLGWFYDYINNVYVRGPFFTIRAILVLSIAFLIEVHVLLNKNALNKQYFKSILILPIAPPFFGILQIFVDNFALEYCGMVLTLLTFFVCLQNKDVNNDFLTDTMNRRCFDKLLNEKIEYFEKTKRNFSVLMVDVDKFKNINDNFGHEMGDKALVEVSNILKKSFKKSDNICRYGGDEFCIISELDNKKEIEKVMEKIQVEIKNFNKTSDSYKLGLSMGYSIYKERSDVISFLKKADDNMYAQKEQHHAVLAAKDA